MARIACSVSQRSGLRPSLRRRRRNTPIAIATTALLSFASTLVYPPAQSRILPRTAREVQYSVRKRTWRFFHSFASGRRIGLDRAQVGEGLPSLRLSAGRLIDLAHDANRRLLDRANLWRASSVLRRCRRRADR